MGKSQLSRVTVTLEEGGVEKLYTSGSWPNPSGRRYKVLTKFRQVLLLLEKITLG